MTAQIVLHWPDPRLKNVAETIDDIPSESTLDLAISLIIKSIFTATFFEKVAVMLITMEERRERVSSKDNLIIKFDIKV